MAFDEARHDPLVRSVDGLHILAVFDIDLWWDRSNAEDAVALHHHRVVLGRRLARSVNQGAVADYHGVNAVGAHNSSFRVRFPSR